MKDIRSITTTKLALTVAARTASVEGATVDCAGYNSVMFSVVTAAVSTASEGNGFSFKLQDSPDGTNWTDVPIGGVTGAAIINATAQANSIIGTLGYTPLAGPAQRYVRIVGVAAGTTNATFGALAILQGGRVK